MEILNEYLIEDALIIVPVLFVIGRIIKETPRAKDWVIPYILLVVGILLSTFTLGFSADAVMQGVLSAGVTVFSNELVKQAVERD